MSGVSVRVEDCIWLKGRYALARQRDEAELEGGGQHDTWDEFSERRFCFMGFASALHATGET